MHCDELNATFLWKKSDLASHLPLSDINLAKYCREVLIHYATSAGCLTFHHVEANIPRGNLRRGDCRWRCRLSTHRQLTVQEPARPNS